MEVYSYLTDEEIIYLLKEQPIVGFNLLVEQYSALIYSIVWNKIKLICSSEDVEECVSDVLVKIYRNYKKIDLSNGSIKAYIMLIAKRTAIDYYRKFSKNVNTVTWYMDDEEAIINVKLASNDNVEEMLEAKELEKLLLAAIKKLDETSASMIILKYYYGESSRQIAKRMKMSNDAVKKRVSRGLKKLKEIINEEWKEGWYEDENKII